MIDGVASHPFSAETLSPPVPLLKSNRDKIISASRERYSIKKEIVEEKIIRWTGLQEVSISSQKPVGKTVTGRSNFARQNVSGQENTTILYDAVCSNCGKPTKVIFSPEPGKPVYCKSCLKKLKRQNQSKEKESLKIKNISFSLSKKEKTQKRKEINLSELKKALEESLENKKEEEQETEESQKTTENKEAGNKQETNNEDKNDKKQRKGIISPGEKIKL